jgi:hypothetical protein
LKVLTAAGILLPGTQGQTEKTVFGYDRLAVFSVPGREHRLGRMIFRLKLQW